MPSMTMPPSPMSSGTSWPPSSPTSNSSISCSSAAGTTPSASLRSVPRSNWRPAHRHSPRWLPKDPSHREGRSAWLVPAAAHSRRLASVDEHLERVMVRRMAEDVVGLKHLVESELMGDELVDRQLMFGDELQQHAERVGVHEPHRDGDVGDPQLVELEFDGLAVHTDVGHVPTRAHDLRGHREGAGKTDCLDGHIDSESVAQGHDLVLRNLVHRVLGERDAYVLCLGPVDHIAEDPSDPGTSFRIEAVAVETLSAVRT